MVLISVRYTAARAGRQHHAHATRSPSTHSPWAPRARHLASQDPATTPSHARHAPAALTPRLPRALVAHLCFVLPLSLAVVSLAVIAPVVASRPSWSRASSLGPVVVALVVVALVVVALVVVALVVVALVVAPVVALVVPRARAARPPSPRRRPSWRWPRRVQRSRGRLPFAR